MSAALIASAQSTLIGIVFSWVVLLPGIATVLIIIAIVGGRGEDAEDAKVAARWGPRANRSDD